MQQGPLYFANSVALASLPIRSLAVAVFAMTCTMLCAPNQSIADERPAVAVKVGEIREAEAIDVLDITSDGEHVAIKTVAAPIIHIWGWRGSSHILRTLSIPSSPKLYVGTPIIKYSPTGHRLAVLDVMLGIANQGTAIHLWDSHSGALLHSIGEPHNFPTTDGLAYSHDQSVLSLYHPRVESPDYDLDSYRSDTWTLEWRLSLGALIPWSLISSPNGQLAAIGGRTGQSVSHPHRPIVIVNLATPAILREIDAFPNNTIFSHIAWSPDSKQIAAGVSVGAGNPDVDSLKIFAVATGERTSRAIPPQQNVADLAFGGDGKYLIVSTTGLLNVITIWDSSLKSILQTIPLGSGPGRPIAASHDGHFIAIADDAIVGIWEIK